MESYFHVSPERFAKMTGSDKERRRLTCPTGKCCGVLFSVQQPRIRHSLGQETFQCNTCKSVHVVQIVKIKEHQ